ncbi:MAG: hypothetical protein IT429_26350 [Gemmataceae bacterium]|nr:hypothetical protein [Gemmataceae bacterium]
MAWLILGLAAGLVWGGVWPDTPLHAVSTDRGDTFAIATGPVDGDLEAIYFLDFLSGDLKAAVMNQMGKFTAFYAYNVLKDFGTRVGQNPRYLMVTGGVNIARPGGGVRPSRSAIYIADATTGQVAAYAIPWAGQGRPVPPSTFVPLDTRPFRTAAIRKTGGED